ncbi:MAG: HipA family kinase [Caldilineaceae bacterium]
MLRTVTATRYIQPLREGGSLPAIVEADDGELYVMKFVGAGQGAKALIAELIAGEIGRVLGLRVPEIVLIELDAKLARSESHQEIQDLLQASVGLNLALRYLPSAFAYNPLLEPPVEPTLASTIVWFDAYVTNVDRTPRNVNMLLWEEELWLIDHGAALYFHHDWGDYLARSRSPFAFIKQHVLLPLASQVREVDPALRSRLSDERLAQIVAEIPTIWLGGEEIFADEEAHRNAYLAYLCQRRAAAEHFVEEAANAYAARL